ncbi:MULTISPECIES: ABC transporter permease [Natrinema]|uniref:ABC-2 type transporter n=1 Tax=Natrinema gari JCM 14663 TaxID=1230459 RepID=L9Z083_9EURY|nr:MULTISPECIES: ABC transporter permease [Natrinema]AFO55692.1 ABC-2 type transporter [Natrinema sp. J7-2]ELY79097.1 ABC-2 type transporter [Natrinema gari JCM 14663]
MSAITVAKKDFRDAIRSRVLIGLTVLFALFTVGGAALASWVSGLFDDASAQSTIELVLTLQAPAGFLVPIIALIVGYGAIAGERESGSLKFLLGLPHRRRDILLGKVLGRTGVVAVSIFVGFTIGLLGLFAFVGSVSLTDYVAFTAVTILFGLVYVAIGVGFSAMTRSTTRAAVGALSVVILFKVVWGIVGMILLSVIEGMSLVESPPDWYLVYNAVTPDAAYGSAIGAVLNRTGPTVASAYDISTVPLVAEPWFGFVILAIWAAIPIGLGLWRFDRVDL